MTPISQVNFIVVDVETTGSITTADRITDIACITVRNYEIVDSYNSLINPHRHIPHNIQRLTKITDEMVSSAPDSPEVMSEVNSILEQYNTYFVAHSATFDWGFVRAALKRENLSGYRSKTPLICSLKIAQRIIPPDIKKNVGSLAEYFNIPMLHRHRAFDDAFATANFFIEMLYILQEKYDIKTIEELIEFQVQPKSKPTKTKIDNVTKIKLEKYTNFIPPVGGIIKFIDKDGVVLFVNYASNMKQYISEYITTQSSKIKTICKNTARIDWTETQNELEGQVVKLREIKKHTPKYNKNHFLDVISADNMIVNDNVATQLIKDLSLIIIAPNSAQEKLVDVYFIRKGKYRAAITVGTRANTNELEELIHHIYFNEYEYDIYDIDEVHIINNWLTKNQQTIQKYNYYNENENNADENTFTNNIKAAIKNFYDNIDVSCLD